MELIKAYGIEVVVDVRRFPTSRFEHFRRENLRASLKARGIEYIHLGGELGGYRKGGYEAYALTEDFSAGLAKLEDIASGKVALFLCAERLPWRCHRRFIARALERRGWRVVQIIEKGRHWEPQEPE